MGTLEILTQEEQVVLVGGTVNSENGVWDCGIEVSYTSGYSRS